VTLEALLANTQEKASMLPWYLFAIDLECMANPCACSGCSVPFQLHRCILTSHPPACREQTHRQAASLLAGNGTKLCLELVELRNLDL
jgi:hypothetical protein